MSQKARKPESKIAPQLAVEWWPIARPQPYAQNARKLSDRAVELLAKSLKEFGWRQPIVVDKKDVIVAGHTRLLAAQSLGMTQVPVHVALELTAAQIRAYRIMDNRSADESEWDEPTLQAELAELAALEVDLSTTGLDGGEIAELLKPDLTDEDDVPAVPKTPITQLGDLWTLGKHRLLCGDSTDQLTVNRLMNGERAGLMNTDPPYGVGYANDERPNPGVAKPRVAKDDLRDESLQEFLEAAFQAAKVVLNANAAWYLWHAHLTQGYFAAAAAAAAAAHVILHRQIIWVKPVLLLGRGQYHWKHEPCFMGWVEGNQPPDYSPRTETTVWEIGSVTQAERDRFGHSTPKPVELFRRPIMKHLQPGEICYEPFAGSGPQFIAAEMTGRRCFGLELELQFVDVIVRRWEQFTGAKATLEGDGRTFDEIAKERGAQAAPKSKSSQRTGTLRQLNSRAKPEFLSRRSGSNNAAHPRAA